MSLILLAQIQNFSSKNRIHVEFYNAGDLASMKEVIKIGVTQLVWVETPNNPNCSAVRTLATTRNIKNVKTPDDTLMLRAFDAISKVL